MKFKKTLSYVSIAIFVLFLFIGFNTISNLLNRKEAIISTDYYSFDTDDDLINNSDVIIDGIIISSEVQYLNISEKNDTDNANSNPGGPVDTTEFPYTVFKVEVTKVFKGDLKKKDIIEVKQLGGEINNTVFTEENAPKLKENDRYLLFLTQYENSPYSLLNPIQGSYKFENNNFKANTNNHVKIDFSKLKESN